VEEFWNQTRKDKGLEPAPVAIRAKYVLETAFMRFWQSDIGTVGGFAQDFSALQQVVGEDNNPVETELLNAEDALAMACYQDKTKNSGWRVECYQLGFFNSVTGWVVSPGNTPGPVLEIYQGHGPFAISKYLYWDNTCSDNCLNQFHQAVANLWNQRLLCVQRAMPSVFSAIVVQIEKEANPNFNLSSQAAQNADLQRMGGNGSGRGVGTVLTVAALGGSAAAVWYFWPQIRSFFAKL
jgi:hypothetical protein